MKDVTTKPTQRTAHAISTASPACLDGDCESACAADAQCSCYDFAPKGGHCRQYHGAPGLAASSSGYDAYTRNDRSSLADTFDEVTARLEIGAADAAAFAKAIEKYFHDITK